jgi:F-type H+-transporting ATPase subunit a
MSNLVLVSYEDKIAHMFDWSIDAPLYSSLIIMAIILVFAIIVGIEARVALKKKSYLERPHGLLMYGEWFEEWTEGFVKNNMGPGSEMMTGYFMVLIPYLFIAFNWGLTGLPTVIDWLAAPLSLSIIMFILIQATALHYQKLHYFHRYIEPFAIFLPINLVTMWTPIISTSMRMFGNCLAGTIIIGLVQWALGLASGALFGSLTAAAQATYFPVWDVTHNYVWTQTFLAPIPMGILNLYFSLFSGFVQTTVFVYLNALWMAQEKPADEPLPAREEKPLEVAENKAQ